MDTENTFNGDVRDQNNELLEIAHENFKRWNEALHTLDPKAVAELYSKDATFLPTLNPEFKKGQEGAEAYFHHFLEKSPDGKIAEEAVQALGPDSYIHSGMYNFEVGPEDNRQIVEARFTFVWQRDEKGDWKAVHHHSSLKPNA